MLQRPFPKLKKHRPTRIYMLYPMVQSVALVCVEIYKKMPSQGRCPSIAIIKIIFGSFQNWNETWKVTPRAEAKKYVTSIKKLNFEFCHT
jgi:hypothetical protein